MNDVQFGISLGTAQHGWLPISVNTDAGTFDFVASGVLNDPLDELVSVAVELAGMAAVDASVRFWEEPGTTALRFVSGRDGSTVTIELMEQGDWPGKSIPRSVVKYRGEGERHEVARSIIATLRAFEASTPRNGQIEGWGLFPSAKLRSVAPARSDRLFIAPWREVRGLDRVVDELRTEAGRHHPLFGLDLAAIGHLGDTDDYLIEIATGPDPLAVVRLTWSGERERDPNLPATEFFSSWDDWVQRRALLDASANTSARRGRT